MAEEIWNSGFDNVEYGTERTTQSSISISPLVSDQYEESTSENMDDLYTRKRLTNVMMTIYEESQFAEKYGKDYKKIERCDFGDIYYYFKNKLRERDEYNLVQIFCTIAEFFDLNYKTLYNDVISLEDKVELLETLQEDFGLEREFSKVNKLF